MTREELQSAIQDFFDEAFHCGKHEISDTSKAIALECMMDAAEHKNLKPLTLEELRRMDGEVVYIPESEKFFGGAGIVSLSRETVVDVKGLEYGFWPLSGYGADWLAYH